MTREFGERHVDGEATLDEFAKAVGIDLRNAPQDDPEEDEEDELNDEVLDDVEDRDDDTSEQEQDLTSADLWSRLHRAA